MKSACIIEWVLPSGRRTLTAVLLMAFVGLFTMGASAEPQPSPARLGAVEGVVTYAGKVPLNPQADDAGQRRPVIDVDPRSHGVRFVVVHLIAEGAAPSATIDRTQALPAVLLDQQGHAFMPHIVAVRCGQPVVFTNSDPANHNVRASSPSPTNEFNVFTSVGGRYEHRFAPDAQGRPVRLDCDIHPWMRGWIYVFDHSLFAVTDAKGKFSIPSVPPGRYQLVVRQPDLRFEHRESVDVKAGHTNLTTVRMPERPDTKKQAASTEGMEPKK